MSNELIPVEGTRGYFAYDAVKDQVIRVKSCKTSKAGRVIKCTVSNPGYWRWTLCFENQCLQVYKHRFLMKTFNPVDNMEKLQVNHIDGDKLNCSMDNLEWVTDQQNKHHAKQTGLSPTNTSPHNLDLIKRLKRGILNGEFDGRALFSVAKEFGVDKRVLYELKHGRSYKWLEV